MVRKWPPEVALVSLQWILLSLSDAGNTSKSCECVCFLHTLFLGSYIEENQMIKPTQIPCELLNGPGCYWRLTLSLGLSWAGACLEVFGFWGRSKKVHRPQLEKLLSYSGKPQPGPGFCPIFYSFFNWALLVKIFHETICLEVFGFWGRSAKVPSTQKAKSYRGNPQLGPGFCPMFWSFFNWALLFSFSTCTHSTLTNWWKSISKRSGLQGSASKYPIVWDLNRASFLTVPRQS